MVSFSSVCRSASRLPMWNVRASSFSVLNVTVSVVFFILPFLSFCFSKRNRRHNSRRVPFSSPSDFQEPQEINGIRQSGFVELYLFLFRKLCLLQQLIVQPAALFLWKHPEDPVHPPDLFFPVSLGFRRCAIHHAVSVLGYSGLNDFIQLFKDFIHRMLHPLSATQHTRILLKKRYQNPTNQFVTISQPP